MKIKKSKWNLFSKQKTKMEKIYYDFNSEYSEIKIATPKAESIILEVQFYVRGNKGKNGENQQKSFEEVRRRHDVQK